MKRVTLFLSLLMMITLPLFADNIQRPIGLEQKGGYRSDFPMYFDMPQAFYCYDAKSQWIIIDGEGVVNYYDVEISSPVTNTVEISTQVDGTYDTFYISSLPAGTHVITITSPSGNIFEGTFISY